MPTPPDAITGTFVASTTAGGQLGVEPVAGAVAVHRGQQDLPRSQLLGLGGPGQRIDAGRGATTVEEHLERRVTPPPSVDRHHHTLAPELLGQLGHQLGPLDRGGVDRDLVGTGPQDPAGVLDRANATTDRERDEDLVGGPAHDVDDRVPIVGPTR